MTSTQFTLKNLLRRPTRTVLTVMGIGVSIGALVALIGLAWGVKQSWGDAFKVRKTDLVVRKTNVGFAPQPFDEKLVEAVRQSPDVAEAANYLMEILSIEEASTIIVSGREWGSFMWDTLDLVEGAMPANGEEHSVVLGKLAAEMLGKKPGDTITIEVEEFKVTGIVDGKAVVENGSVILSLSVLQRLMQKTGQVNFINIRLKPGVDIEATARELQKVATGCRVDLPDDVVSNNDSMKTVDAMNWGTSAVALLVATFGVMNTMFMSVYERTREIGILIALGWHRWRILRMILWESIALCFVAGIVGIILGISILKILVLTPMMRGKLEPYIGWDLIGLALAVSVTVGILSGLFPALHCTKINPSEAIR